MLDSYDPNNEENRSEAEQMGAEPWMLEVLELNGGGWTYRWLPDCGEFGHKTMGFSSWPEAHPITLGVVEVVSFLFEVKGDLATHTPCEGRGCEGCGGIGGLDTPGSARVALNLWLVGPSNERSACVVIEKVERHELPEVIRFLAAAGHRTASQFREVFEAAGQDTREARRGCP
jgi:hypothetical protein